MDEGSGERMCRGEENIGKSKGWLELKHEAGSACNGCIEHRTGDRISPAASHALDKGSVRNIE